MNSPRPTAVRDEKTVSPPRPARISGVSRACVCNNDRKYPIKVAIVETQSPRDFLSTRTTERTQPAPTANSLFSPSEQCAGSAIQHQSSSAEQSLLTEPPAVRKALLRMVIALEENFHTREDLLQEALVSFWSSERQYPGQRRSWYLQSVRFHLHHIRASGRSLDSPKHRWAQATVADNGAGRDEWLDTLDSDQGIMSEVQARDIFSVLVDRLKPIDQVILGELAEGRGVCDIAEKLNVSHVFVVHHRRRIARAAISLGISPVAAYPIRRASSKKSKPAET